MRMEDTSTTTAPVPVFIGTYNSRNTVGDALASLVKARDAGIVGECLVVDNQSADGTASFVRQEYGWCTLIESGGNLGFGRAANIGIERSTSPYVLLLNPGATLPPEGIERLVAFLDQHSRACAAGPAILGPNGRGQMCGTVLTPKNMLLSALAHPGAAPRDE